MRLFNILRQIFFKKISYLVPKTIGPFYPGHFYSPIPNLKDIKSNEKEIFRTDIKITPSININHKKQISLIKKFTNNYQHQPFTEYKTKSKRYYFLNPAFGYADSLVLYSIIRHYKPKNIIEVGSGYSSCVTLDTNELFFKNKINCTFIEPYPKLLKSLLKKNDTQKINLIDKNIQEVDLSVFKQLNKNDILFIDSTHVSKVGSDVNYIFFSIIPQLKKGVIIHFHDIFYPFEYPKEWIYQGYFWNESYLLRAFLQNNNNFKIIFFNDYLAKFHPKLIKKYMPLNLKNTGGSFWLQKVK